MLPVCVSSQERLRDIVEKLTVVSQHRVEVLKVCVAIIITCVIILAVITGLLNLADCINTRYNQNLT